MEGGGGTDLCLARDPLLPIPQRHVSHSLFHRYVSDSLFHRSTSRVSRTRSRRDGSHVLLVTKKRAEEDRVTKKRFIAR